MKHRDQAIGSVSSSSSINLTRRTLLAGAGAAALGVAAGGTPAAGSAVRRSSLDRVNNALVQQRADARIFRHADGNYYMTASVPEYDRLVVRGAPTIAGLATAEEIVIWRRPTSGTMGGHIWAPELHHLDGKWYVYFAAGDSDNVFRIRTYAISSGEKDPRDLAWGTPVRIFSTWDTFMLDSTVFEHRGVRYFAWAQGEPGIQTNSNLYLAPMLSPTSLALPPARLAVPTLPWEIRGFRVNEGQAFIVRNGRIFMTFSASATDARYALGLLTADEDADLMDPASWVKSPEPVFVTTDATSMYGPGHNQFTLDEEGRDVLVYHARDYRDIVGDPLHDPNRHTRVQRLYWKADGTPDFGVPVGSGPLPYRLEPANRRNHYVAHDGTELSVTDWPAIETAQFRLRAGLAGASTTSFEPILAPGQYLCRTEDDRIVVAAPDGSPGFAARASFARRPGLADARATSWQAAGDPRAFLSHVAGGLQVERDAARSDRPSKTFYLD